MHAESEAYRTKSREWQSAVDTAVVEAELMKSRTEQLEAALIQTRANAHATRELADRKSSDVVALSRENLLLEAKIADLARDLEASKAGLRLLAEQRARPPTPPNLGDVDMSRHAMLSAVAERSTRLQEHLRRRAPPQEQHRGLGATPVAGGSVAPSGHHDASTADVVGWESVVGEIETDRQKAHDELAQIDGEIVSLQQSLRELTGLSGAASTL
jgi:hypothetical protein